MNLKKFLIAGALALTGSIGANAQIFYKVTGNGLENPSYIFGTHHLAPLKVLTENKPAMDAFKEVSAVVTEVDMTQDPMKLQAAMAPFMLAPTDSTLSKVLTPEQYEKVSAVFNELTGFPILAMDPYRPMVVSTNISMLTVMKSIPDFNLSEQLDTYIGGQGKALGKKNLAFETAEQQAEILFASTPIAEQAKALVEMAEDTEKLVSNSKRLNDAYFAHDLENLFKISMEEEENPEFMEKLLDKRNADWLTKLPAMMNGQSVFVGVGAMHLAGPQGLVEGLRKLGYTVEAVN